MIKGFLLDIDGTLLDSNDAHAKAWATALEHFGYAVTPDEVRTLIGMGGDRVLPTLVPELDVNHGKGKEIAAYRRKYFIDEIASSLHPTPGARELLLALKKRNVRLVVATSASGEELQTLLWQAEIDDLVHKYTTASDVAFSKPAPDLVAAAVKKIQLNRHDVFMLGDTPYDIAAAKKNGIQTLAVRCGGFSDEQLQGARCIFDSPHEILKHIDNTLLLNEKGSFTSHLPT